MALIHAPPPTNNSLNPEQRTRLLRSTRKLEALLGATPHLLDSEPTYIPKAKLSKRHAIIRSTPAQNSSVSSFDSTEPEYVSFTSPLLRLIPSPSSSRSVSPVSTHRLKVSVTRESMSLLEPAATNKKTKGPQALSQPLLLRLRALPELKQSVPVPPCKSAAPIVKPFPLLLTPAERRRLKVDSVIGPLSPINHSHSRSFSIADLRSPISPAFPNTTASGEPGGLTDREKRWKMAKLHRTLGENVPLELVFGQPRPKTDKKTKRKSRSVTSYARPGVVDLFVEDAKPSALVAQVGTIAPIIAKTASSTTTASSSSCAAYSSSSTANSTTPILKARKHRHHRPRSLTLGSASALVAADIKLAEQNHHQHHGHGRGGLSRAKSAAVKKRDDDRDRDAKMKDTRGTVSMDEGMRSVRLMPLLGSSSQSSLVNEEEWKRKEREWSGEWNVRNMHEVAKALRGLKAR